MGIDQDMRDVMNQGYKGRSITVEWTEREASAVAAALTYSLDLVGETVPSDSDLRRALAKLTNSAAYAKLRAYDSTKAEANCVNYDCVPMTGNMHDGVCTHCGGTREESERENAASDAGCTFAHDCPHCAMAEAVKARAEYDVTRRVYTPRFDEDSKEPYECCGSDWVEHEPDCEAVPSRCVHGAWPPGCTFCEPEATRCPVCPFTAENGAELVEHQYDKHPNTYGAR